MRILSVLILFAAIIVYRNFKLFCISPTINRDDLYYIFASYKIVL